MTWCDPVEVLQVHIVEVNTRGGGECHVLRRQELSDGLDGVLEMETIEILAFIISYYYCHYYYCPYYYALLLYEKDTREYIYMCT